MTAFRRPSAEPKKDRRRRLAEILWTLAVALGLSVLVFARTLDGSASLFPNRAPETLVTESPIPLTDRDRAPAAR